MASHVTRRQFVQTCSLATAISSRTMWAQTNVPPGPAPLTMDAAIALAQSDPDRPIYHFHPPANWNNDPNGTIYYRGWHHLFYQFNPTAPRGGNQHWGHARSRDLVNWDHLPIAIAPSTDKGERAIFSGGAVLDAKGRPRLFYTSIGHPSPEQWMASPDDDDLISWTKYPQNPVLAIEAHGAVQVSQWRDPFLFKEAGHTYIVCGGNLNNGQGGGGSVQLYRAENDDLTRWKFLGVVFQYKDLAIYNVECPNLFKLGSKWILLMSPQQPCEYFIGNLDIAACRFTPEAHGVLDAGNSYASNISVDNQGRTILWLWGRTNTAPEKGWNGVMVMPRVLSISREGFLLQQPAAEFAQLRGAVTEVASLTIPPAGPVALDGVRGDALELEADLVMGNAAEMGFDLRCSTAGKPGISVRVNRNSGLLSVGSSRTPIRRGLDRYRLRIFLDKRVVEVYVNDGEAALYATVDASPQDLGIFAVSQAAPARGRGPGPAPAAPAPARIDSLRSWPLKAATFTLDKFHV
jgi:beta-fructofuranosidase